MKFFAPRYLASTASLAALVALATTGAGCSSSGAESELGVAQSALIARPAARLFLSPNVLTRLKARAAAGDAAWTALKAQCDGLAGATMNPPNGPAYPNSPDVGQGYQGEEYVSPTMALGLCYRVTSGTDDTAAARYGAAGDRLLAAISAPGAQSPSTDSGYGIRNYGFSMALGYDWLYPALSQSTKSQVIGTMNAWIDWYDQSGFIKNDPIGNYFIGYFLAKTTGALATEGDNPKAAQYWDDVQNRMWGTLVKPAFTKSMAGGGWPEGWEYGPRSVRGLVETLWAVKTARGIDWAGELPQIKDQSNYLTYFAWPSLQHMDDTGTVRSGTTIAPSAALVTSLAMIAEYTGDTATAANARGFAADVIQSGTDDRQPWQKFLYWDGTLAKNAYTSRPLSYVAKGPGHVAMRSTWAKDATWGTLMSGTYINAGDSGEQLFNQGSLAVVRGDKPVIVNASGWIPQVAGTAGENFVYDDSWGSHTRRLYNSFFVADADNHYSPGQSSTGPDAASTHVEKVDELGGIVRARAANVEQMYRSNSGAAGSPVSQFNRDLVYLRPGTFVVYDRTTIAHPASDSWIAFHTPTAPTTGAVSDATQRRYDIGTLGSVRTLLPRNAATSVVSLPGGVARIEAHDPAHAGPQDWLTVVTATDSAPDQVRLSASDGNVSAGNVVGVHVKASRQQVVLFPAAHAPSATTASAKYTVQQSGDADHVLVDMAPGAYAVTTTVSGGTITVDVHPGGSLQPTANGTLAFTVTASGGVSGAAAPVTTPSTPSTPTPSPSPITAPTTAPVVSPTPAPTTPTPSPTPSSDPSATPTPTPTPSGSTGTAGTNTTDSAPVISLPSYVTRNSSFVQGVDGYNGARDFSISTVDRQWNPEGHTYAGVDRLYSYDTTVGQYTAKSLLAFDVSSIPANSVVKGATLEVTVESWANGLSLVGDYVTTPWSGTRAPGWIHASDGVAWGTPGIGASDVANKAFTIGGLTAGGLQRKTITLDTATVQAWVSDPSKNHGFVVTNPKVNGILRIVSSEAPVASQRPKLTIEYAGP